MKFPQKVVFGATLLLASVTVQAQKKTTKSAPKAPAAADASTNSLLWEVSGKGLSAPSYVYGTFHMMCPTDMSVAESVKQAVSKSSQVVLELDMDDPSMGQQAQAGMMMQGGQNLQQLLSPADYTRVGAYLQAKANVPIDKVSTMKPFLLGALLMPAALGCAPASYEMAFVEMAKAQKKEVLGLETVQDQLGVFDKIPYAEQSKMLTTMVSKEAETKQEVQQMVALYKAQKIEALHEMFDRSVLGFPQYNELLLDARNRRWVPTIEKMATAQSTFFAVGAGHLGGPKGVLALLREQGYRVRPITQ
jgi:hypothetical protein